ncbi:MAG: hypothetical protein QOJ68_1813 [Blastococcus sp.]|nr:hypothetical protein [Blastococcus sp.]
MNYRSMPIPRFLFPVILVVFLGVAIALIAATVLGNGPPVAFLVLWIAAFGWNAYWWSLRICTEVSVDGLTLNWRTGVLSGTGSVGDVLRVRPSRWSRQMAVIEVQGRRPLLVPVRYGFGQLVQAIAAAAPHASVESG